MSHANGEVIVGDSVVGYFEYSGTADLAFTQFYDTIAEVSRNWRSGREAACTCKRKSTRRSSTPLTGLASTGRRPSA
jgi:hypothetical protein